MRQDLDEFGCNKNTSIINTGSCDLFNEIVTNKTLRKKTEKLFKDGHHARAVEEAYKLLDNVVKKKANLQNTNSTGSSLMQKVFTPNNPILKLNSGTTASEQDEQSGYEEASKERPKKARKIVSENLGHHRTEVTRIYLADKPQKK